MAANIPLHDETSARIALILTTHIDKARPDNIRPDTHLRDDLGVDSLDQWTIVVALESEFKIYIPDEKGRKMATVRDIYHTVTTLKAMQ